MKVVLTGALLLGLSMGVTGYGQAATPAAPSLTVAGLVAADPQFSTLKTALDAAGLTEVLNNADLQFTVFAPTNGAFAKVPKDALDALLADKEALKRVLLFHVAAGSLNAAAIGGAGELQTLAGDPLAIVATKSGDATTLTVGGAGVTGADLAATNGTVHAIDTVLMPPAPAN